jgi:hypothetical protein
MYGVTTFRFHEDVGLGVCCRPGGLWSTMPHVRDGIPPSDAFWPKPVNLFGLFAVTTFIADLHVFTIPTTSPSPG